MKNWTALYEPPANAKIICLFGGTASGKTYTALKWCILMAVIAAEAGKTFRVCVCRKTYPELRAACWDVAYQICIEQFLFECDLATVRRAPTPRLIFSDMVSIDFKHADRPEEIKGAEYDVWLLDEVTDISRDFYRETLIRVPRGDRTRFLSQSRHILTWNPVSRGSWVFEEFFGSNPPRGVFLVKSTYRDNPHVSPQLIRQLMNWKETDPRRWRVYGLGDWGSPDELIYPHWRVASDSEIANLKYSCYGVDFGYANPTAVVGVSFRGNTLIVDELLYRSEVSTGELIEWLKYLRAGGDYTPIYCDPADPKTIVEIQRAGIYSVYAGENKPVTAGIAWLEGKDIAITPNSQNLRREIAGYCWSRDAGGQLTDKPVKILDHAMDALRYAAWSFHTGMRDVHPEQSYRPRAIFG